MVSYKDLNRPWAENESTKLAVMAVNLANTIVFLGAIIWLVKSAFNFIKWIIT